MDEQRNIRAMLTTNVEYEDDDSDSALSRAANALV